MKRLGNLFAFCLAGTLGISTASGASVIQHVFVIVMENHDPVSKNGEAIKDKNSHFTIYDAQTTFPDPLRTVNVQNQLGGQKLLIDQFQRQDEVLVLEPLVFCVPVVKKYGGEVYEINNPRDHLTIYRILGNDYHTARDVKDQFFPNPIQLAIFSSQGLAVPSLKLDWSLA